MIIALQSLMMWQVILLLAILLHLIDGSLLQKTLKSYFEHEKPIVDSKSINNDGPIYSSIEKSVCHNVKDKDELNRIVCCTPSDVRHLYNVLIQDKKIVLFLPKGVSVETKLPPVVSVKNQASHGFNMPIEVREGSLDRAKHCKAHLNGTLHAIGRSTTKNVYHAVTDNVMPLISQILLDGYLAPEFLNAPRKLFHFYQHQPHTGGTRAHHANSKPRDTASSLNTNNPDLVPHMQLVNELLNNEMMTHDQVHGLCVDRLVWGHGPHIFYVDSMQILRRKTTEFLRLFLSKYLFDVHQLSLKHTLWYANEANGSSFASANAVSTGQAPNPTEYFRHPQTGQGMRMIVYTRGNSGRGRTMQQEQLLVTQLQAMGANVFLCCDFTTMSLEQQLLHAYYADVIVGLHGAAITHGIFMAPGSISIELKTLYGYESMLFGLIADSRQGIHGQVDIRKYFVPGGHRAMDNKLIYRTVHTIRQAMVLQQEFASSLWSTTTSNQTSIMAKKTQHRHLAAAAAAAGTATSPSVPKGMHTIGRNNNNHNKPPVAPQPQQPQQPQTSTFPKPLQAQPKGQLQPGSPNPVAVNLPEPNLVDSTPPHVMSIVPQSVDFQEYTKYIHIVPETEWEGDFVYAPFPAMSEIDHVLGPKIQGHKELCKQLIFYKLRTFLGMKEAYNFHCDICGTYVA